MLIGAFLFFVFGTVIGSFLNVVVLRYHGTCALFGRPAYAGRSRCFSCGNSIKAHDLIPILSFCLLRGRCRHCRSKISIQYPLVEALTGLIFAVIFLQGTELAVPFLSLAPLIPYPFLLPLVIVLNLWVWSFLIAIGIYDLKHKIIQDALVWAFVALGFFFALGRLTWGMDLLFYDLLQLSAGPLLAIPFALLWLVSRGRWIGLGDAKLALGMGWFAGPLFGFSAVTLGFWAGALWSICVLLLPKLSAVFSMRSPLSASLRHLSLKSEIPLAPFLILGLFGAQLFFIDAFSVGALFR